MQIPLFSQPSTSHKQIIALDGAAVTYYPGWLNNHDADQYFTALKADLPWQQDTIKLFGKSVKIPRLQAWHGDSNATYRYSGLTMTPHDWMSVLPALKQKLEAGLDTSFNSVLANWYRDGQDSMAMHSDDEPELGPQPVIASLTFGHARPFVFKHRKTKARTVLPLAHGSLLVMAGDTQVNYHHGIAKTARAVGDRINLTFRYIYPDSEY